MPRFKNEEVEKKLNNIDEALKRLYKDVEIIQFNPDPKIAEIQKATLLFRLINLEKTSIELTLKRELSQILDLSHPVTKFILEQEEDKREPLFQECVISRTETRVLKDIFQASRYEHKYEEDLIGLNNAIDALFKPKPDNTKSMKLFGANFERSIEMEKAQEEIDAIPLDVPAGLNEDAVTYATIGFLFEPDSMANIYAKSMNMKGSTLVEGMDPVEGARTLFFESFLANNNRVNMHAPRLFTPDARRKAKEAIEEYKKGNKKPVADALARTFKESLYYAKFASAKGIKEQIYVTAAKMLVDTAKILDTPEFAKEVNISFESRRWVALATKYLENVKEYRQIQGEIDGYIAKRAFKGIEGKPMDDPEIRSKVEKLQVLDLHIDRFKRSIESNTDAISMGTNITDTGTLIGNRIMTLDELYYFQSPKAYNERLLNEIRNSKGYQDLCEITDLNKFISVYKNIDSDAIGKEFVENIDLFENVGLKNELNTALKDVPSKYGDLKDITKKLSCMKNNFKKEFTQEDLEKRIEEYEKAIEKIQEKYPEGAMRFDESMQMDVDCIDDIVRPLRKEINRLQDTRDIYEKEIEFKNDLENDYIVRSLKEAIDPNINVGFTFSFKNKDHNDIDVIDAAEQLQNGEKVTIEKYGYGEFIGQGREISYNKDSNFKIGIPKVCSRETSLESASRSPVFQLENLKKVKEVLEGTDPFYVSNSTEFNNTMKALDKVIQAQTYIGENPNIRQVETLKSLYEDLNNKATLYTNKKTESIKVKDSRGTLRLDTIKSLQSIIKASYVNEMTSSWYAEERHRTNEFREISRPVKMMNRWIKTDLTNIAPEKQEEFLKDFNTIMKCAKIVDNDRSQMKYAKMGMAFYFDKMLEARLNPNLPKLSNEDLEYAKDFSLRCNKETANYASMEKEIKAPTKEKTIEEPVESLRQSDLKAFTFNEL